MIDRIATSNNRATIRWKLLTSASVLSLLGSTCATLGAGSDADRPILWIELGGQAENIGGQGEHFAPPFIAANSGSSVLESITPLQAQRLPKFSFGEEGQISFQPEGSDWLFSAAIRIGRSGGVRHVDHQTAGIHYQTYRSGKGVNNLLTFANFADTHADRREHHTILDFTVGKDFGLGLLGSESSSTINVGVRVARFASRSAFDIRARPDLHNKYFAISQSGILFQYWHSYHATGFASRSFHGVGPTLSWTGSAPFAGNSRDGEIEFDWGVNAALLFGRQKAHVRHHETAYYRNYIFKYSQSYNHPTANRDSARSVTVPNIGGFAGLTYRYADAKLSFGYRADFFFGAVDGGIDARKSETLGFKGPYASISVGLGD